MYSTYNEGKSVISEQIISTLKNKIYKYMSAMSRNAYIDKLSLSELATKNKTKTAIAFIEQSK